MTKQLTIAKTDEGYSASIPDAAGFGETPLDAVRKLVNAQRPITEKALAAYFEEGEVALQAKEKPNVHEEIRRAYESAREIAYPIFLSHELDTKSYRDYVDDLAWQIYGETLRRENAAYAVERFKDFVRTVKENAAAIRPPLTNINELANQAGRLTGEIADLRRDIEDARAKAVTANDDAEKKE